MKKNYMVVKCPSCGSTSEIKLNGERPGFLICPVCLEGEIECPVELRRVQRVNDLPAKPRELVSA